MMMHARRHKHPFRPALIVISLIAYFSVGVNAEGALQPAASQQQQKSDDGCRHNKHGQGCSHGQGNKTSPTSTTTTTHDGHDHEPNNDFFAWNWDLMNNEDSLLRGLFPDLTRLRAAWEKYPLLSKVSFSEPRGIAPLGAIPTIFHNRSALMEWNSANDQKKDKDDDDPLTSLFSVDDSLQVLAPPHMKQGSEYQVVRKVDKNGEEFLGSLPHHEYTIDEIIRYFKHGGMSLVVNGLQRRWNAVSEMATELEEELDAEEVNVNLYLTPWVDGSDEESAEKIGRRRQGFEAHWDYMDIIIVQLAGRKRWSIAREPIVYLSPRDQKRKPTIQEMAHYAERDNRFMEFTLCPGDVLYVPRGHIHNASTIDFDNNNNNNNGGLMRKWADWDACPSYPKDVAAAESLEARVHDTPSLHLTFGLGSDVTVEALVHHALNAYFAEEGANNNNSNSNSHSNHKFGAPAIPAHICSSPHQKAMQYDGKWQSVLHHALVEVARRENDCDNPSYRGIVTKAKKDLRECNAILRQSVPLLLLTNNELNGLGSLSNSQYVELSDHIEKSKGHVRNLRRGYLAAVRIFAESASISKTIEYIETQLLDPTAHYEKNMYFDYPGYRPEDAITCPSELEKSSSTGDLFAQIVGGFIPFAETHFHAALKSMNVNGKRLRNVNRERQRVDLEKVGQGGALQ